MTVYDHRDRPAYPGAESMPDEWADNRHILAWWTERHDNILKQLIRDWRWAWWWKATTAVVANTPAPTLDAWRKRDGLCKRYAWYNVLSGFCRARAQVLGFTGDVRPPEKRTCLLCSRSFVEDSLPVPIIERLGADRLVFCAPCVRDTVFFAGRPDASRDEMLDFASKLTRLAGRVPPDGFGTRSEDFVGLDDQTRTDLLRLLGGKPSKRRIADVFGSWFDLLVAADVLEDGARRTSRGTQCRACDGHLCYSLGEKTIDDLLYALGVPHSKEPHYPDSNMRADFEVGGVLVEYFGLAGDPEYDAKTGLKASHAKEHKVKLIAIYPKDVCTRSILLRKLAPVLPDQDIGHQTST